MTIKRIDIFGEEGPALTLKDPEDRQFMYTYTACMKQFLEEVHGLGQDVINALFEKYKVKTGEIDGRPVVAIEYPGGGKVPDWIVRAAKKYAKESK